MKQITKKKKSAKAACTRCGKPPIYYNQGQYYCQSCFLRYIESKVFRTIRKYDMFKRGDNVCVATSGGKDSLCLLYLLTKYCRKYGIKFFALGVDEGIEDYRDHSVVDLKKFCKDHDVELHIVSFKDKVGDTLDNLRDKALKKIGKKPCTVCGVFRRTLLNVGARELGATKIATGHNLDDESQTFLMNLFFGNMGHNAGLGPISGLSEESKFVQRVKPLYFITEKETRLFCFVKKFQVEFNECPNIDLSFRAVVRDELNNIEQKMVGSKYGVVNAFLDVLPDLKKKYAKTRVANTCKTCGEIASGDTCNYCQLIKSLDIKKAK